ncbi:hypothetical protein LP420_28100 [Massilia sp. B-10]|nr:hypothetical protein LP420_28100 [Massilia sp. B-10]UUZ57507.1 hypothetical protein LP419_27675 [Massilia sp. H-1]
MVATAWQAMQFLDFARSALAIALDDASADNTIHNIRERFMYFSRVKTATILPCFPSGQRQSLEQQRPKPGAG